MNQSSIKLIHNPRYHKRTKHIDVLYHLIREHQASGAINVLYINTAEQLADLFTKALAGDQFAKM
jgi:hypothetical protein